MKSPDRSRADTLRHCGLNVALAAILIAMLVFTMMPAAPAQEPFELTPFAFTSGDWSVGEIAVGRAPSGGDAVV
ncbi:MAG: hypothetical protein SWK76_15985 [Actinomycetota bacterium]|nr:hypothetical protein [Actinomycetota bacterium]